MPERGRLARTFVHAWRSMRVGRPRSQRSHQVRYE